MSESEPVESPEPSPSKRKRVSWLPVVLEFMAIFLGVTLSLLADDWRSGREDREQETAILSALTFDLDAEYTELENLRDRMLIWDAAGARLHAELAGSGPPAEAVDDYFRPMFYYYTYRPVSTAYVNLREGGRLSLIDDPELRSAITAYYEIEQDYMIQFYGIVQDTYFLWRRVAFRHVQIVPEDLPGSFFPPDRFDYRTSWEAFRRDPEAPALLQDLSLAGANFAVRIENAMEENRALRNRFAGEDQETS